METAYTVSTYLIKKLHECGVKHIFGVPGDYVLGLYDQLIRTKTLEVINTCDEQAEHLLQTRMHVLEDWELFVSHIVLEG